MTTSHHHRVRRVVIAGAVLNDDQRAGRACVYCPVTFGALDPAPAPAGIDGVMFLATHRACVEGNKVARERRALGRRGL